MNNFEHAERLAELTAMGTHELALMVIRLERDVEAYQLSDELQVALRQRGERDEAIAQRDYLVAEYERAVKCGPQGFSHAAGHLYNAISNAKCDANAERFIAIQKERDAALEREQDKREHVHRLCLDYQSLCEKLEMSWEREAALAAHVERIKAEERRAYDGGLSMPGMLHSIIHKSPATSLDRRDTLKQAETLDELEVALKQCGYGDAAQATRVRANDKRKQAEGLSK